MIIHLSTQPIRQASRVRGVGIYARHLAAALAHQFPDDQYLVSDHVKTPVDLVHYPYFEPFFLTLNHLHTTPFIVTIHDLIPLKYPAHFPPGLRGRFKWQLQQMAVRRASHIITDSDASAADIESILRIPAAQVSVIPLAPGHTRTTAKMVHAVAATYHLPPRFALYVGDINWNKNVPGLIKEFANSPSGSLHLVLVGQAFANLAATPEALEIKAAIAASGKSSRIHLIGYIPSHHLPALYNLATVYVQPSWDEGFGLTILEAMAAGCPVLSSSRGSLPEVGGGAVAYFDPAKPGDLAAQLSLLARSPALRTQLIAQGKLHLKSFSWAQTAQLTHTVYEKVLADR